MTNESDILRMGALILVAIVVARIIIEELEKLIETIKELMRKIFKLKPLKEKKA